MLPSLGSPSTTSTSTFGSLRRGNAAITSSPVSTSQSIKTRVTNLNQIEVAELKTASNLSAETPRMINMDIASNSGSLKRATGSGDVLADSRQEVQNYISTTKDIPKLREKSPADCGSLKRYVASGVLAESNQKSNRPESDIPRMLDVMANESGNLKRSVGSGDVLLDYLQQQVVDSTVQGIPKVRHNSDVDNGSLKRATASGDMCSSAKEALDYMRAEVPKVIDGSIQNLRRVAASNAGLLHSREFSVKSAVETLKGSENLESADLRRMTSSSRCAATNAVSDSSDSRVTLDSQASSKQFREVNRRGLESPTRSKRASREINSFQADANDSRPQSHTWNSADKKPDLSEAPPYVTLRRQNQKNFNDDEVVVPSNVKLSKGESVFESEANRISQTSLSSLPRPPSAAPTSIQLYKRSHVKALEAKRSNGSAVNDSKSLAAKAAVEDYIQSGLAINEDIAQPSLLAKHKRMEQTNRMRSKEPVERTIIAKMHICVQECLSRHLLSRHRWRYSIFCVLRLIRSTGQDRIQLSQQVSQGIKTRTDIVFLSKLQALLTERKSTELIQASQRLLSMKTNFIGHLTLEQQQQLCRMLEFVTHVKGSILVHEGHERKFVYFVLSGSCETRSRHTEMVHILKDGDTFGTAASGTWTATVRCTEDVEVLRLNRAAYETILRIEELEDIQKNLAALMCIPHFVNSASQQVLKAAARACQIFKFKPQDPILYEGVENYSIFWILKGSCRAVKLVPFLKRYQTAVPLPPPSNMDDGMKLKKSLSRRYKLAEYEPGVTLLRQSDKVVTQLLTIDELGLGDMFPDMVGVTSQLNGDDLITRLSDTSATRLDSRSYVSIIASSDVEIIGLTRVDYASIATDAMLKESFEATSRLRVPLTVLQQSVLSSAET